MLYDQPEQLINKISQSSISTVKKLNNNRKISNQLYDSMSSKVKNIESKIFNESNTIDKIKDMITLAFGKELPLEFYLEHKPESQEDLSLLTLSFKINQKNTQLTEEQQNILQKIDILSKNIRPTIKKNKKNELILDIEILDSDLPLAEDIGIIIGTSLYSKTVEQENIEINKEKQNKKNQKILAISGVVLFCVSAASIGAITMFLLPLSLPIALGIGGGAALISGIMTISGYHGFKKSDNKIQEMLGHNNKQEEDELPYTNASRDTLIHNPEQMHIETYEYEQYNEEPNQKTTLTNTNIEKNNKPISQKSIK